MYTPLIYSKIYANKLGGIFFRTPAMTRDLNFSGLKLSQQGVKWPPQVVTRGSCICARKLFMYIYMHQETINVFVLGNYSCICARKPFMYIICTRRLFMYKYMCQETINVYVLGNYSCLCARKNYSCLYTGTIHVYVLGNYSCICARKL